MNWWFQSADRCFGHAHLTPTVVYDYQKWEGLVWEFRSRRGWAKVKRDLVYLRQIQEVDGEDSEMADSGELARRGSASSGKGHLADVEEMRVQISKLQEQKAEALNRQVVELQTENDKVVGRMKLLQKTLEGIIYTALIN